MKKEQVTKFDLESAFRALDEIEIPKVNGGVKSNRMNLREATKRVDRLSMLIEDYYDVGNTEDLQEASEEREDEIAKAKLARIEKIVDLDAESEDDILPSYVGKIIIQCPQCMTLFYKKPEDVIPSDEDPDTVNVGEECQHCGNNDGYTLIGKVAAEEGTDLGAEAAYEEEPSEDMNLGELPTDIGGDEENTEISDNENEEGGLDELEPMEMPEENNEEGNEEELKEAAFKQFLKKNQLTENITNDENEILWNIGTMDGDYIGQVYAQDETSAQDIAEFLWPEFGSELCVTGESTEIDNDRIIDTPEKFAHQKLGEAIDPELNKKLEEHNAFINYLQSEIKKAENELKTAKNDEIKSTIQSKIDTLSQELENALPDSIKGAATDTDELPELSDLPDEAVEEDTIDVSDNEDVDANEGEDLDELEAPEDEDKKDSEPLKESDEENQPDAEQENDEATKKADDMDIVKDYIKTSLNRLHHERYAEEINDFEFVATLGSDVKLDFDRKQVKLGKMLITNINDTNKLDDVVTKIIAQFNDKSPKNISESKKADISSMWNNFMSDDVDPEEISSAIQDEIMNNSEVLAESYIELNDKQLNSHISKYLTSVYENVKNFKATKCDVSANNKLIIEGNISFNSGRKKHTKFEFTKKSNNLLEGINKDLSKNKAFKLRTYGESGNKILMTESLEYNYTINGNKVSGKTKNKGK